MRRDDRGGGGSEAAGEEHAAAGKEGAADGTGIAEAGPAASKRAGLSEGASSTGKRRLNREIVAYK